MERLSSAKAGESRRRDRQHAGRVHSPNKLKNDLEELNAVPFPGVVGVE
jgi:hypothetical protein